MKLCPVTKIDNKNNVKKFDDEVMSGNCEVISIFLIYGTFGTIRKTNSGRMICKFYIFYKCYLTKTENRTKNSPTQLSHYYLEYRYYFGKKKMQKKCKKKKKKKYWHQ